MDKKYYPVRVKNPTSAQHLVRLKPGQDICLVFDNDQKVELEVAGNCLELEEHELVKPKRLQCTVRQTKNIDGWEEYSSVFLGEIWVDCDKTIAKISVVLDCGNNEKSDHITIINPDCFDVRVQPHQVIELIVYDLGFSSLDEWNCSWNPLKDVHLEQIGYDHLSLQAWHQYYQHGDDDPGYRYARFPRTEIESSPTQWTRQHHFWFRFDKSILNYADVGVNHVGNFVIAGVSDRFSKQTVETQYHMSLYLDTKKFKRGRVLHTLGLKKKNEYAYVSQNKTHSIIHVPSRQIKETLPVIREVGISNLQPSSLEEGCKVISATPSWETVVTDYDEYDEGVCKWQQNKWHWWKNRKIHHKHRD